jgi:hypothetical protein
MFCALFVELTIACQSLSAKILNTALLMKSSWPSSVVDAEWFTLILGLMRRDSSILTRQITTPFNSTSRILAWFIVFASD